MIPLILVMVWHRIAGLRAEITCTVHDSILLECHPDDLNEVKDILVDCFTKSIYGTFAILYGLTFSTQLGAELKISDIGGGWGTGTSEKHEAKLD